MDNPNEIIINKEPVPGITLTATPKGIRFVIVDLTKLTESERGEKYVKYMVIPAKFPHPPATPLPHSQMAPNYPPQARSGGIHPGVGDSGGEGDY